MNTCVDVCTHPDRALRYVFTHTCSSMPYTHVCIPMAEHMSLYWTLIHTCAHPPRVHTQVHTLTHIHTHTRPALGLGVRVLTPGLPTSEDRVALS